MMLNLYSNLASYVVVQYAIEYFVQRGQWDPSVDRKEDIEGDMLQV